MVLRCSMYGFLDIKMICLNPGGSIQRENFDFLQTFFKMNFHFLSATMSIQTKVPCSRSLTEHLHFHRFLKAMNKFVFDRSHRELMFCYGENFKGLTLAMTRTFCVLHRNECMKIMKFLRRKQKNIDKTFTKFPYQKMQHFL